MRAIRVPRISANEDIVTVVAVNKGQNELSEKGEVLCILETSKAAIDLEAEIDGCIYFVVVPGDEVIVGQTVAYMDAEPIDPSKIVVEDHSEDTAGLTVTKKAQALLDSSGVKAEQVKSTGVLRLSDVEAHLGTGSGEDKEVNPVYEKLDEIIKSDSVDGVGLEDVERLKKTLAYASDLYTERWDRTIPSIDVLFDRWVAGARQLWGEKSNVSQLSYITGDVKLGRSTFVGPFTILDGSGGLEIGDHCSIAAGVHIYSHDTIARALSGYKSKVVRVATTVGNSCFIGPHSVITKGVSIGDHCFVAANSVVMSDLPPYTAVQGNPAQVIGEVTVADDGSVKIRSTAS